MSDRHLHLAIALDGAGWHPAAWRTEAARPTELLTARYWVDLVQEAQRGLVDFVTFEDGLSLQSTLPSGPDGRTDLVRGRLDAVLVAARVAPLTKDIGLVPDVVAAHTEPFHASKAVASLDYASTGRAGLQVRLSVRRDEALHFGRREAAELEGEHSAALFEETEDYIEVVRRLWDSWEDDAEVRDVASGRFIDRAKLHYVDFEGRWFSVKGPSITPRPPQGQAVVTALASGPEAYRLLGRSADVGFVTPRDGAQARAIVESVRNEHELAGRAGEALHVFGDIVVFLDSDPVEAAGRKSHLDGLAGEEYASDASIFVGSSSQLADLLEDWEGAGLTGFRLRPGTLPGDLEAITQTLVPELQRRGRFRRSYEASTLRGLLGLPRPDSRYVAA
jgi:alkanesulfonate monooxygenase SsuD/methylene tetrahydromethanopterin reductase-like flavin-dependent oxidoreductase (luciferase family)